MTSHFAKIRTAWPRVPSMAAITALAACTLAQPPGPVYPGPPAPPATAPDSSSQAAPDPGVAPATTTSAPAGQTPPAPSSPRDAFAALARAAAQPRKLAVTALSEVDLDGDGKAERVALLCTRLGVALVAAYLIERDERQRWLIDVPEPDGRTSLDSLGSPGCPNEAPMSAEVPWTQTRAKGPWIHLRQTYRGGITECHVALRDQRPAVIWSQDVGNIRDDDVPVTVDYDALQAQRPTPYPDLASGAQKFCGMLLHVKPLSPEDARALLGAR